MHYSIVLSFLSNYCALVQYSEVFSVLKCTRPSNQVQMCNSVCMSIMMDYIRDIKIV